MQRGGEGLGVLHDLLGVLLELGLEVFAERDGLGGDDVHQRAALAAGEDAAVDVFVELFVVGEDQAAARAAEGFVGGGGDDVGVREGGRVRAADDQAGDVGDVGHQQRADFIGDLRGTWRSRSCAGTRCSRR